ncbi:HdeD family acid-resistance protein [Pedobacter boryungensis]|uniref:DUF308 domain-containing protein n=1 Tax=Pedobacter boryungensis TaxID=869962 RepID=A0ABX2DAZ4_9SPHI|nr:DUF308 domain-containing protein [Pedobacter boryungensis]NQX30608.1 DUF308 domain-containing protein [Pedobacter boryungensis]
MKIKKISVLGYDTRYWWLLLGGGILFIALGTWIILTPEKTYLFMSQLLSAGMLFTGLFDATFSVFNSRRIKDWGWIFTGGVIDTILGVYFLNYPLLSLIFMPMVIGLWMMFRAFMTVSSPIALQALGIKDFFLLILTSGILILPSLVILIDPFAGLANMVIITGIGFLLSGIFRIIFSQQLRKLKKVHISVKRRKKYLDRHVG